MKQLIKMQPRSPSNRKPKRVAGLDPGNRYGHYCVLTGAGELVEEARLQSTEAGLRKQFANELRMRIALEAGTHWALGQPVVREPRQRGHSRPVSGLEDILWSRTSPSRMGQVAAANLQLLWRYRSL